MNEEILSLSEIKNLIEENNTILRAAIQTLEIISNQPPGSPPMGPQLMPSVKNEYPGYTLPAKYGFMSKEE